MRFSYKYLIFILLAFFIVGCSSAPDETVVIKELEKLNVMPASKIYSNRESKLLKKKINQIDSVFQRLEKLNGFNGTVLYAEKGRLIYEKAFGYADPLKKKHPLTVDSQFELASVSKMFTATAIMILKEEGKIDYDADLRKYIPEWPYEGVTIRHLLTHRSGMPRYESLADEYWPDKHMPISNDQMIQLFVQHQPSPYFKPNNGFHYCNTNYALLGSVVEKVSKMKFEVFMKKRVFGPARMEHSFIYHVPADTLLEGYTEMTVQGHDQRGRRLVRVPNDYLNGVVGDKIMYSTVGDLYLFEIALNNEKLVSKETLHEAYSPGSPSRRGRRDNYGFGWRIRAEADSAIYHYGWWKGFRTFFIRDLKQEKTLIVLTNKAKGPGSEHFWDLINDKRITFSPASANPSYIPLPKK